MITFYNLHNSFNMKKYADNRFFYRFNFNAGDSVYFCICASLNFNIRCAKCHSMRMTYKQCTLATCCSI